MLDNRFADALIAHWPVWLVTVTLVVAAIIDGRKLKVPNWLTFPMILSGLIYGFEVGGWSATKVSANQRFAVCRLSGCETSLA